MTYTQILSQSCFDIPVLNILSGLCLEAWFTPKFIRHPWLLNIPVEDMVPDRDRLQSLICAADLCC